jgi:hypothetical protein
LTGLPRGQLIYFAVRGVDESGNLGPVSNTPCILLTTPAQLCEEGARAQPTGSETFEFGLELLGSHPVVGRIPVRLAIAPGLDAKLEVLDVAGRRVMGQRVAWTGAGPRMVWLGTEHPLRPGFYVVRLTQGGRVSQRGVVLTR